MRKASPAINTTSFSIETSSGSGLNEHDSVSTDIPADQWIPFEITQYGPSASPPGRFTVSSLGYTLDSANESGGHEDLTSRTDTTGGYGASIGSGDQAFFDHLRRIP
jgi:hypothetical protein